MTVTTYERLLAKVTSNVNNRAVKVYPEKDAVGMHMLVSHVRA